MRDSLARFGPQAGMADLLERWPAAVGPEITRFAWPARIARDGTIHVATADSIWAFELGQRAYEIGARLGGAKLRFAPGPLPEPDLRPPPAAVAPTRAEELEAARLSAEVTHPALRETVQRALGFALARRRSDPPF